MEHPELNAVTKKNGPRPAGKPNRCFYCDQMIGQEHTGDCVLRKRTVMMRASFEVLADVPANWTTTDILHKFNDSSYCADNLLGLIEDAQVDGKCLCDVSKVEFIREATAEDEARYQYDPDRT